jgi:hypothetical protein
MLKMDQAIIAATEGIGFGVERSLVLSRFKHTLLSKTLK